MLSKETIASDGPLAFSILAFDQPDHLIKLLRDAEGGGVSGLFPRSKWVLPACLGKDLDVLTKGLQTTNPEMQVRGSRSKVLSVCCVVRSLPVAFKCSLEYVMTERCIVASAVSIAVLAGGNQFTYH